tara:strand:+ start:349 stop:759 length:411 start_codon:yes stop_codon:yes gene_type:complete
VTTGATITVTAQALGGAPIPLGLLQLEIVEVGPSAWESDFIDGNNKAILGPNDTGTVFFSHTFAAGVHTVPLKVKITVSVALLGNQEFTIPLPYDGSNFLLNTLVGTDYSDIDALLPGILDIEVVDPVATLPVTIS